MFKYFYPTLFGNSGKPRLSTQACQDSTRTTALYPPITPFETGMLEVSKEPPHRLYYEVSGNEGGQPVVFLHGGPGGGVQPSDRRQFDPKKYKIVLFDQRGCGKSEPSWSLEGNTTWNLVADIEKLREKLKIDKWVVFGGSWGSTLSLAYAQTHPERVKGLVLRGIWTVRKSEVDFFYQSGTSRLFPEAWEGYIAPVPEAERGDLLKAYSKLLNSDDEKIRLDAAKAWAKWEMTTYKLKVDPKDLDKVEDGSWTYGLARIENHYFINKGFMREGQLLEKESIDRIRHIPTIVVQGRYDVICPVTTAWELKKTWPEIELHIVTDAGHSEHEPGIAKLLVEATDRFASL